MSRNIADPDHTAQYPPAPCKQDFLRVLEAIFQPRDASGRPEKFLLDSMTGIDRKQMEAQGHTVIEISPEDAHRELLRISPLVCDTPSRLILLEYLLSSDQPNILRITGLPIVPVANNDRDLISLSKHRPDKPHFIVAPIPAIHLFRPFAKNLIALHKLSQSTAELIKKKAPGVLNVQQLSAAHVHIMLHQIFPDNPDLTSEREGEVAPRLKEWLVKFWNWVDGWEGAEELLVSLQEKHMFPILGGAFRRVRSNVFSAQDLDQPTSTVLHDVGVPILDPSIQLVEQSLLFRSQVILKPSRLELVLQYVNPPERYAYESRPILAQFISRHLLSTRLDELETAHLRSLPIFPIIRPSERESGVFRTYFGSVGDHTLSFLDGVPSRAIPTISGGIYIDISNPIGSALANFLKDGFVPLCTLDLVRMSIYHWSDQFEVWKDALAEEIVLSLGELQPEEVASVGYLPIIPVGIGWESPRIVVDPEGLIASLLPSDHALLPQKAFAQGSTLLSLLRQYGLIQAHPPSDLFPSLIHQYVNSGDPLEVVHQRAINVFAALDEYFSDENAPAIELPLDLAWIPCKDGQLHLATRSQRKDPQTTFLYDKVLAILAHDNTSPRLCHELGWSDHISVNVICRQITEVLKLEAGESRVRYFGLIILHLSAVYSNGDLSAEDLACLQQCTHDAQWIPISNTELAATNRAVFARVDSALPFKKVRGKLLEDKPRAFLEEMGCCERPSAESILAELNYLIEHDDGTKLTITLLRELCEHGDLAHLLLARIHIPDVDGHLRPHGKVFIAQSGDIDIVPAGWYPAHPEVQPFQLQLQLPGLDEVVLRHYDRPTLPDDRQVSGRIISSILAEREQPKFHKTLAFFIQKGATSFSVVFDTKEHKEGRALTRQLGVLQASKSLVLYSNVQLDDDDIVRLRRFDDHPLLPELFHVSDCCIILSGSSVLFLDPAMQSLPSSRTSCLLPLDIMQCTYDMHVSSFQGLFEMVPGVSRFAGTMIRLPLRTSEQAQNSACLSPCVPTGNEVLQWLRPAAPQAFLFSDLVKIEAHKRAVTKELDPVLDSQKSSNTNQATSAASKSRGQLVDTMTTVFRLVAHRSKQTDDQSLNPVFIKELVKISGTSEAMPPLSEEWLVTHSQTPSSELLGASDLTIKVSIATPIFAPLGLGPRRLFSTLPLLPQADLPFYLNAPFDLTETDARDPSLSAAPVNSWILSQLAPPLYLFTVQHLLQLHNPPPDAALWCHSSSDTCASFFTALTDKFLPSCTRPVLRCVSGGTIAPSQAIIASKDSEAINSILIKLRADNFVRLDDLPFIQTSLRHRTVTESPQLLGELLRTVLGHDAMSLQSQLDSISISVVEVDACLTFLVNEDVSFSDLPLLVMQDGKLHRPDTSVILDGSIAARHVFPPGIFVSDKHSKATIDKLKTRNFVKDIDLTTMIDLVSERLGLVDRMELSQKDGRWAADIWSASTELGIPLSELAHIPLIPTLSESLYVSIDYCTQNAIILWSETHAEALRLLSRCGVVCVHPPTPLAILGQKIDMKCVINCLKALGSEWDKSFEGLMVDEHRELAGWLRAMVGTYDHADALLHQLPIWEVHDRSGSHQRPTSALKVHMLPQQISFCHICPFLEPGMLLAEHLDELSVLIKESGRSPWTVAGVYETVTGGLKGVLREDDLDAYITLVEHMLDADFTKFPLPNRKRVMTDPRLLFHPARPLFQAVYKHTAASAFPHPALEPLLGSLRRFINSDVTPSAFTLCARAVAKEKTGGLSGANALYNHLCQELRVRDEEFQSFWNEIQDIAFIPARDAMSLPAGSAILVAPREALLADYEAIAGSQRIVILEPPSPQLRKRVPSFGVPQANEVVEHLVYTASIIGTIDTPPDRSVHEGLTATYSWLNQHAEQARTPLLDRIDKKLFLNVDDPSSDKWVWNTAEELVLNLFYESNCAKRFLTQFPDLLWAAGSESITIPDPGQSSVHRMRDGLAAYDELRKSGKSFDLWLRPTDTATPVATHRWHFAIMVKEFAFLLSQPTKGQASAPLPVAADSFSLKAILDFIYTGGLDIARPKDKKVAFELLKKLLNVLSVANKWKMTSLKHEVGRLIVADMSLLVPETLAQVKEAAKEFKAPALLTLCSTYETENANILKRLLR